MTILPGTILHREEIDRPGIELENLLTRKLIRTATPKEVADFYKQFPKDSVQEADDEKRRQELKRILTERIAKSLQPSDKAGLCLELIGELKNCEAALRNVFNSSPDVIDVSEAGQLKWYVKKNRELRRFYGPCDLLKQVIRQLAEPLCVAAEGLDDPQFASTPLHNLIEQLDQQYHNSNNPTFQPAEEFLKRLRPKLLSREQRAASPQQTPPISIRNIINNTNTNQSPSVSAPETAKPKGLFGLLKVIVNHPVISSVIAAIIAGFISILIYNRWGYNVMDPSSSRPMPPTSQGATRPATRGVPRGYESVTVVSEPVPIYIGEELDLRSLPVPSDEDVVRCGQIIGYLLRLRGEIGYDAFDEYAGKRLEFLERLVLHFTKERLAMEVHVTDLDGRLWYLAWGFQKMDNQGKATELHTLRRTLDESFCADYENTRRSVGFKPATKPSTKPSTQESGDK